MSDTHGPPRKARLTIEEIYKRSERADQLAAIYGQALKKHADDARAAQLAADRFKCSANEARRLANEVRSELEWLVVQLKDMADDAIARKAAKRAEEQA